MTKSIDDLRVMFEKIRVKLDQLQAGCGDTAVVGALEESFRTLQALVHAAGADVDVGGGDVVMSARRRPTTRRRDGSADYLVPVTFANCHSIDPAAIQLDPLLDRLAEMGAYSMTAPPFTLSGHVMPVWEFRINTRSGRAAIAAAFALLSEAGTFSIERDRSFDELVLGDDTARV